MADKGKGNSLPKVLGETKMGSNWMVYMCQAPNNGPFFQLNVHHSKAGLVKIEPLDGSLEIPQEYIFQMKNPPDGFFAPMFSVINMFEDKVK